MEREWILSVLEEGLSDGHCYDLCEHQGIFKSILGFSSSPLCDEQTQVHTAGHTMIQHTNYEIGKDDKVVNSDERPEKKKKY